MAQQSHRISVAQILNPGSRICVHHQKIFSLPHSQSRETSKKSASFISDLNEGKRFPLS